MSEKCPSQCFLSFLYNSACPNQFNDNLVPYQTTPKYNTRRRAGSQIIRRRSMSQTSLCSAQSDRFYQTPQSIRHPPSSVMASPSPSRASVSNNSDYGTLRRYPPEAVQQQLAGFEPNVPRILVIPRGLKGFGFILRGTKSESFQLLYVLTCIYY